MRECYPKCSVDSSFYNRQWAQKYEYSCLHKHLLQASDKRRGKATKAVKSGEKKRQNNAGGDKHSIVNQETGDL
eukprot:1157110-Pelagomonas_calceolata.AAC.6